MSEPIPVGYVSEWIAATPLRFGVFVGLCVGVCIGVVHRALDARRARRRHLGAVARQEHEQRLTYRGP